MKTTTQAQNTTEQKSFLMTESDFEILLSKLQRLTGFIYFDSADNLSMSYCVWDPVYSLQTFGKQTHITNHRATDSTDAINKITSHEDPFILIETYVEKVWGKSTIKQHNAESDSGFCSDFCGGFCGGAMGYWGYELGGRVESLPEPKHHNIELPDMFIGIYDFAISYNSAKQTLNVISHPNRFDSLILEMEKHLKNLCSQPVNIEPFKLKSKWQANMTQTEYADKFKQVKQHLIAGDCYQVNLAQRFTASYSGNEWVAYLALRHNNKAPFSSFIRLEKGAILSLSPERFLQVKSGNVETKPIKGTRPRSADKKVDDAAALDLRNAIKDRAENLMIVDLLRNDVSKVAKPGSVKVPKLFDIESYPAVHHLVSTVTASLKADKSAVDLLRGAFPGGSITGAPKISAMNVIHKLEPHPRSVYCGAIGYILPNGDMDTNISIRTLVCNKNNIYCWAGGGLVIDSEMASEYQETLDKVHKILPVLEAL